MAYIPRAARTPSPSARGLPGPDPGPARPSQKLYKAARLKPVVLIHRQHLVDFTSFAFNIWIVIPTSGRWIFRWILQPHYLESTCLSSFISEFYRMQHLVVNSLKVIAIEYVSQREIIERR